jgi:hypothetical protein
MDSRCRPDRIRQQITSELAQSILLVAPVRLQDWLPMIKPTLAVAALISPLMAASGKAAPASDLSTAAAANHHTHVASGAPAALRKTARKRRAAARPYSARSPWNKRISAHPSVSKKSGAYIRAIADNHQPLTSDPDNYTIPVYTVTSSSPKVTVTGSGSFSAYDSGDKIRKGKGSPWKITIRLPRGAASGSGSDGQIEILDPASGLEYGFWQFRRVSAGHYRATNGYRYHTTSGYTGRFADGRAGRGAGTPYLAGLVRPWEIKQGHIDHALAFGYHSPAHSFVFPASKTDGAGRHGVDLPEGTRLQLSPSLKTADFKRMHLNRAARIIARALQLYGMYVIDNSGSSKVYLEARSTAHWGSSVHRKMLSGIPWSKFRVIAP